MADPAAHQVEQYARPRAAPPDKTRSTPQSRRRRCDKPAAAAKNSSSSASIFVKAPCGSPSRSSMSVSPETHLSRTLRMLAGNCGIPNSGTRSTPISSGMSARATSSGSTRTTMLCRSVPPGRSRPTPGAASRRIILRSEFPDRSAQVRLRSCPATRDGAERFAAEAAKQRIPAIWLVEGQPAFSDAHSDVPNALSRTRRPGPLHRWGYITAQPFTLR